MHHSCTGRFRSAVTRHSNRHFGCSKNQIPSPFLGGRLHHGNGIAISTAVDRKIEDIGRDHLCPREFFGKPHHACVRQIHLRPVLVHPCGQRLSIRLQQRNHNQLFPRGHLQDPIHRVPELPQLPANLGQHRFARHGRRIENITRVAHVGLLTSPEAFFDGKVPGPTIIPAKSGAKRNAFAFAAFRRTPPLRGGLPERCGLGCVSVGIPPL